jgi:hypothetical protein
MDHWLADEYLASLLQYLLFHRADKRTLTIGTSRVTGNAKC